MLRNEQITSRISEIDVELEAMELALGNVFFVVEADSLVEGINALHRERAKLVEEFEVRNLR